MCKIINKFAILSLYLVIKCCLGLETVTVDLEQGTLSGLVNKTIWNGNKFYSFRGIPYAESPVNELRFQPPRRHIGWKDKTYEAHNEKPTCYQYNVRTRNGEPFGISGSEDCLYLSVFTSSFEGSKPVVVFDFSDNFRTGFNGTDIYGPDFFIDQDVIVVYITHRLGVFGFLNTGDDVIPGNAGIKDFILGLQWIKQNIARFGGDPDEVTLMGSRGGAALINILLYSNKAKGLFNKAIMQSGTVFENIYFHEETRQKAFELGNIFNIETSDSATLLSELQKIDAEALIVKEGYVYDEKKMKSYQKSIFPFGPTIENDENGIINDFPENLEVVNDVPVMVGFNSRDGLDLVSHFIFEPRLVEDVKENYMFLFPIRTDFRFDKNSTLYEQAILEIQAFYLKVGYFYYGNVLEYSVYVEDILQNYAINKAVKSIVRSMKSSVFYYVFDFRGLLNENSEYMSRHARSSMKHWGATVCDELCYLLLCNRIRTTYEEHRKLMSEQKEVKVLKRMVRLWTNFIKTKNPTPKEDDSLKGLIWTQVSKETDTLEYLHIGKTTKMSANPISERINFWDRFLEKYADLAVDGLVADVNKKDEL